VRRDGRSAEPGFCTDWLVLYSGKTLIQIKLPKPRPR
jgi:hypothetical protein